MCGTTYDDIRLTGERGAQSLLHVRNACIYQCIGGSHSLKVGMRVLLLETTCSLVSVIFAAFVLMFLLHRRCAGAPASLSVLCSLF